MADQPKSSDLLAAFEQEVAELEYTKKTLERDTASLEGRKSFLTSEIKKLERHGTELSDSHAAVVAKAKQAQGRAEQRLVEAEDALTQLTTEHLAKKSQLDQEIESLQAEIANLSKEIKDHHRKIEELDQQKPVKVDELTALDKQIAEKRQILEGLDGQIETARKDTASELAALEIEVKKAQQERKQARLQADRVIDELEDWEKKLETVKQQVKQAEKQYQEFTTKEQVARKALSGKATSLEQREAELSMAERRARNSGILENMS